MPWLTSFCRRWWRISLSKGLLATLVLISATERSPQPAPARTRPALTVPPRVRGVVNLPLGSEEHVLTLGDFNGDGKPDMALTNGDPAVDTGPNLDPQGAVA